MQPKINSELPVKPPFVFIVGNSRSGTTMLMRMLDKHPEVYALSEWHFFEQLWSGKEAASLPKEAACELASRLLGIQRNGYRAGHQSKKYDAEAVSIVNSLSGQSISHVDVYQATAFYETQLNGKVVPCEKTPQNVFYLKEILEYIPNARVVNLIRDPRSVLLSQKKKANRRKMGATWMSKKEERRLRINYHPITISRLWKSAVGAGMAYQDHPQVTTCYFEDIMANPEMEVRRICQFLGLQYAEDMLQIQQVGSSVQPDDYDKVGVIPDRAVSWDKGGLTETEIYLCQKPIKGLMKQHDYSVKKISPNYLELTYHYLSFPVKLFYALAVNLNRMQNVVESIKRRLKTNVSPAKGSEAKPVINVKASQSQYNQ
jgi:hypothetical protein